MTYSKQKLENAISSRKEVLLDKETLVFRGEVYKVGDCFKRDDDNKTIYKIEEFSKTPSVRDSSKYHFIFKNKMLWYSSEEVYTRFREIKVKAKISKEFISAELV